MHGPLPILRDAWTLVRTAPKREDGHVVADHAWRDAISESGEVFLDHESDEDTGDHAAQERRENGGAYRDDCRLSGQYGPLNHADRTDIETCTIDGTPDIVEDDCSTSHTDACDRTILLESEDKPTDTTDMNTNTTDMKRDSNLVAEESADAV